ncbi:hypothetical protein SAMN05660859_3380 [Ancylobacter rudongensis]|uniref:Uncharacterized protein n=1 Tax=Ancylobacter rudongensis TaxID=177413 RepID=A0A1G4U0Z3_9HYPH|nr:hypothetical protein SAMN05660859_3380 [Ancylobacter rudongensis]
MAAASSRAAAPSISERRSGDRRRRGTDSRTLSTAASSQAGTAPIAWRRSSEWLRRRADARFLRPPRRLRRHRRKPPRGKRGVDFLGLQRRAVMARGVSGGTAAHEREEIVSGLALALTAGPLRLSRTPTPDLPDAASSRAAPPNISGTRSGSRLRCRHDNRTLMTATSSRATPPTLPERDQGIGRTAGLGAAGLRCSIRSGEWLEAATCRPAPLAVSRRLGSPALGTCRRNGEAGADGPATCSSHPAAPPDSAESLYLWQGTGEKGTSLAQLIRRVVGQSREGVPPRSRLVMTSLVASRCRRRFFSDP